MRIDASDFRLSVYKYVQVMQLSQYLSRVIDESINAIHAQFNNHIQLATVNLLF
jgi:hypothetical protein